MAAVAVAVTGVDDVSGNGSLRAVRWALENLVNQNNELILVHVMPAITTIPTPSGDFISINKVDPSVVSLYVHDTKMKLEDIFLPFKKLCKDRKVETLVLEGNNPASVLVNYAAEQGTNFLVLGSQTLNCITRKFKGPGVPSRVLKYAPETCDVYVVFKNKIVTTLATLPSVNAETNSNQRTGARNALTKGFNADNRQIFVFNVSSVGSKISKTDTGSAVSGYNYQDSTEGFVDDGSTINSIMERNYGSSGHTGSEASATMRSNSIISVSTEQLQSDVQDEVEKLRFELQNTVGMYKRACEELAHTQNRVRQLSSECFDESIRVNSALEREEHLKKAADLEKLKSLEAMKEVEVARDMLAKETYRRQIAELNARKEFLEKQKIVNEIFSSDGRYRKYTMNEIEVATDHFSEAKVIGEGSYGKVYKCSLDHTIVAIKVLQSEASSTKKEEFLKEVDVLCRLRHPHLVSLLGACPENCSLVYEYMENESLEGHMFQGHGKPPLPWSVRFRIVFEVACGLAFLHNAKPEPIVHRDLKPGNILIDRNYVSKIGDVGLAKLVSNAVPDDVTEYRESIIAGTLCYLDPEYQRTGIVRPKSDLYAFGVIILQLLTARQPNGLILAMEKAMDSSSFSDMLDNSITDWPLAETHDLVLIALKCSKLRCRDRPDLEGEVLPVLRRLADVANGSAKLGKSGLYTPSHYYCPILQEIMDDPCIAADGFTYERIAIRAWLSKHRVSPVTKDKLKHTMLTPNHTLRSAIKEWKSHLELLIP